MRREWERLADQEERATDLGREKYARHAQQ
jgi:hypothetical protein